MSHNFRVGDRVRFKTTRYVKAPRRQGIGVVRDKYANLLEVAIPGESKLWVFFPHELQYAPEQAFKLERGDRIVNNKTGRKGHVVIGQDNRLWVVDYTHCEETGAPAAAVEEYEEHHPGTYEWTEGPF